MTAEPHIFTLTGNLLAERTLEFDRWAAGQTQRARRESFQVGGKGVNVAKMLNRLGAANTALCFIGGAPGAECEEWLHAHRFSFHAFATSTPTRTGTVVRSADQPETTFLGSDAVPDTAAVQACANYLDTQAAGSVLAICGSLPGWESRATGPLRDAIQRWADRGLLVLDTYGPPLASLVNTPAAFVRINRTELVTLFSPAEAALPTPELLHRTRDRFRVRRWAVSDGPAPVWFIDETGAPDELPPPRVSEVSATGSGDVMLACILHAHLYRGLGWRDAVAWSLPYAAANAAHAGIAEFADPPPR